MCMFEFIFRVEFVIRGEPKIICGTLAVISVDNLSSLTQSSQVGSLARSEIRHQ